MKQMELSKVEKFFKDLGIDIKDESGNYKDTYNLLEEISNALDNFIIVQKDNFEKINELNNEFK